MCSVLCRAIDLLYSWLFSIMVVNKNSLNYCSSSDKSKRRTKTVKKSLEPKWNQTFMYSPVHRREFRERMLEITLWDQARVREEESEFLGEVRKPNPHPSGTLSDSISAKPLEWGQAFIKAPGHYKVLVIKLLVSIELWCFYLVCKTKTLRKLLYESCGKCVCWLL